MEGIIYKWTNKINNKVYIGKTNDEIRRINEHLRDRRKECPFHKALDKYGVENFDYCVLIKTTSKSHKQLNIFLDSMERYYIKKYHSNEKKYGYNLTKGGDGTSGYKYTKEQRETASRIKKGELNPMFGKKWTENQRKLLIDCRIGHEPYNNKEVVQLSLDGEYINTYESALKAAISFGKYNSRSNITKACKNNSTALGYRWMYLSQFKQDGETVQEF